MKKNVLKISLLLLLLITVVFTTTVLAVDPKDFSGSDGGEAGTKIKNLSNTIIGIVQIIGTAVAIIMLIVLAIKYISAAPNDKAEIKKHAVVYVVGAVLLFGATGVLQVIKGFGDEINNTTGKKVNNSTVMIAKM